MALQRVLHSVATHSSSGTGKQAGEEKTSIPDQLRRNREVCEQQGWELADEYVDSGVSGEKLQERPEASRLLADARAGRIDVVVAIDLDRLARDEFVFAQVFRELDRAEVAVHAEGTLYDPENLSQLLTRGIKSVVASHDRRAIVKKMAAGQRARGRAGGWPGGQPPYGYRLVWPESTGGGKPLARVEIDPGEAELLLVAVDAIVDEGLSTGQAAERLNALGYRTRGALVPLPEIEGRDRRFERRPAEWAHQSLRRVLASRALLGQVSWGKPSAGQKSNRTKLRRDGSPRYGEPVQVQLEPLVSPGRFEALQGALAQRSFGVPRPDQTYPNTGATSACGGHLIGVYRRDIDLRQYRCHYSKWTRSGAGRCGCRRLRADWLDGQVWDAVSALLADPVRLLELADEYLGLRGQQVEGETDQLAVLDRQINGLERARVDSARDALKAGLDPELICEAVGGIEAELAALAARRDRLQAIRADQQAQEARAVAIARLAERAARRLPGMDLNSQREVLGLLAVRVTVLDGGPEPALRIEGELPGGGELFGPAPGPDEPPVTGGDGGAAPAPGQSGAGHDECRQSEKIGRRHDGGLVRLRPFAW